MADGDNNISDVVQNLPAMTQFRVRLSDRAPANKQEEQALDQEARDFHSKATLVSDLSDGVQAFTGLISAVLSLPHTIMLVDEPEAFLHPPLARRLGRNLSKVATERQASLVVATHSADLLMGCMENSADLQIIRFTYEGNTATVRSIPNSELKKLMLDPLLRSTNALRGVFHRAVLIAEADKDRAFYEEVNRRMTDAGQGTSDALFLNAIGWQTIPRITKPLRTLGIPAAMIFDLDVVASDQGTIWGDIFSSCGIIDTPLDEVRELRRKAKIALEADTTKQYKSKGLSSPAIQRADVETFINHMADYGVFIVDTGEVECWLSAHVASTPKETWLERIFTAMGDDPAAAGYISPGTNDVWDFMQKIASWINDPLRKGLI